MGFVTGRFINRTKFKPLAKWIETIEEVYPAEIGELTDLLETQIQDFEEYRFDFDDDEEECESSTRMEARIQAQQEKSDKPFFKRQGTPRHPGSQISIKSTKHTTPEA